MVNKTSLPQRIMDWDATNPLHTFQEFRTLDEFWIKDENMPSKTNTERYFAFWEPNT